MHYFLDLQKLYVIAIALPGAQCTTFSPDTLLVSFIGTSRFVSAVRRHQTESRHVAVAVSAREHVGDVAVVALVIVRLGVPSNVFNSREIAANGR